MIKLKSMLLFNRCSGVSARLITLRVFSAALALTHLSFAGTVVWNGLGADQNWSTPGNWAGNIPPGTGDDTKFFDDGANANIETVNNIVDSSRTNLSLQYGNTNLFHTTQINPGVTLVLTGT